MIQLWLHSCVALNCAQYKWIWRDQIISVIYSNVRVYNAGGVFICFRISRFLKLNFFDFVCFQSFRLKNETESRVTCILHLGHTSHITVIDGCRKPNWGKPIVRVSDWTILIELIVRKTKFYYLLQHIFAN